MHIDAALLADISKFLAASDLPHDTYPPPLHFTRDVPPSIKQRCNSAVVAAIKRGDLKRLTDCEACTQAGEPQNRWSRVEAHHEDYAKPLDVVWLCSRHHRRRHFGYEVVRSAGLRCVMLNLLEHEEAAMVAVLRDKETLASFLREAGAAEVKRRERVMKGGTP